MQVYVGVDVGEAFAPEDQSQSNLCRLPTELVRHIAFWLDPDDASRLSRTCRTLHEAIEGAGLEVWRDARALERLRAVGFRRRLREAGESDAEAARLRASGAVHRGPCAWGRCRVAAACGGSGPDRTFPDSFCRVADHWRAADDEAPDSLRPRGSEARRMAVSAYRTAMRGGLARAASALRTRASSARHSPYTPKTPKKRPSIVVRRTSLGRDEGGGDGDDEEERADSIWA